ncbi:LLM class flavin-dependent oxidoreductase [Candidatus Entotheonella serta]|nr:LLM class flavin-dependent oxidoreductase [Candidatus Entotheonella serta]
MKIRLDARHIDVFTISPRTTDPKAYWTNIENVIDWSEKFDCSGILLFTGNDTYVEPWLAAHTVCTRTINLCPLVAVNPVYMHPFTAAKMISTLAYLYKRKIFLNMVTGTALSYLEALNDHLSHSERYHRLREYCELIRALLSSPRPVSFDGQYYKTEHLQLSPRVPRDLQPAFLLAGHSDDAAKTAHAVGGIQMQMLPANVDDLATGVKGIHFGIVTREQEAHAWQAASELFPDDDMGRELLELSMQNTDSAWKMRLQRAADMIASPTPGYWLDPFRTFKADCPYFVGTYQDTAALVATLVRRGIDTFILDIPAREEEFYHVDRVFQSAQQELLERPSS